MNTSRSGDGTLDVGSAGGFEGSVDFLEAIIQFKIGGELEGYTCNVDREEPGEDLVVKSKDSKKDLIAELASELISDICSNLPEHVSKEHLVIEGMTFNEILDKLRCKCDEIKDKLKLKTHQGVGEHRSERDGDSTSSESELSDAEGGSDADVSSVSSVDSVQQASVESQTVVDCKDLREFASDIVDDIIDIAKSVVVQNSDEDYKFLSVARGGWDPKESAKYSSYDAYPHNSSSDNESEEERMYEIPRLTIAEFKPDRGEVLVHDFVKSWKLTKDWKHWIKYTAYRIDVFCDFYEYEVQWSLPSSEYPIPQVTVTVLFIIKVSRVSPDSCPVKVKYYFEGSRTQFALNDRIKHEEFLNDSLCQKQKFFSCLHF